LVFWRGRLAGIYRFSLWGPRYGQNCTNGRDFTDVLPPVGGALRGGTNRPAAVWSGLWGGGDQQGGGGGRPHGGFFRGGGGGRGPTSRVGTLDFLQKGGGRARAGSQEKKKPAGVGGPGWGRGTERWGGKTGAKGVPPGPSGQWVSFWACTQPGGLALVCPASRGRWVPRVLLVWG